MKLTKLIWHFSTIYYEFYKIIEWIQNWNRDSMENRWHQFWAKRTESIFERPELNFPHRNLKFGQYRSCRGRYDLQLWYWTKVDLDLGLGRKVWSKLAKGKCITCMFTHADYRFRPVISKLGMKLTPGCLQDVRVYLVG